MSPSGSASRVGNLEESETTVASSKRKKHKVEVQITKARAALESGRIVESERISAEAMRETHQLREYGFMIDAIEVLRSARSARIDQACRNRSITRLSTYEEIDPLITGKRSIEPGCYLIEPMLVAADGRELRECALAQESAVFVLVREPETELGRWPVVVVGPETVRVQIDPPKPISARWMREAVQALAFEAIDRLRTDTEIDTRVDAVLALVETVVDAIPLHDELLGVCRAAQRSHDVAGTT